MSDLGYITHCSICSEPHKPAQPGWYKHATRAECITALRAALDQERADCERLRAFAVDVEGLRSGDCGWSAVHRLLTKHAMLDSVGVPTALLSGRGEGEGNG